MEELGGEWTNDSAWARWDSLQGLGMGSGIGAKNDGVIGASGVC